MCKRPFISSLLLVAGCVAPGVHGATPDVSQRLVEALMAEGILTERQADSVLERLNATLAAEAAEPAPTPGFTAGAGVQQLRIFGDLRFRTQQTGARYWDSDDRTDDATRYRMRLRLGGELTFGRGLSSRLRFDTGTGHAGRNVDFGNNARRNDFGLHIGVAQLAYVPESFPLDLDARFVIGKQHLPFYANGVGGFSQSRELTVEGLTEELGRENVMGEWDVVLRAGQYLQRVRQHEDASGNEHTNVDLLLGAQMEFSRESAGARFKVAPTFLAFVPSDHPAAPSADALVDYHRPEDANYRDLASLSVPAEIVVPLGADRRLKVYGTVSHNFEGRSRARRFAPHLTPAARMSNFYNVGATWEQGRSEFTAEYRWIGAGAHSSALAQPAFNGGRNNARGLVLEAVHGLTDYLETSVAYLRAEAIDAGFGGFTSSGGTTSDGLGYHRYDVLVVDLLLRF